MRFYVGVLVYYIWNSTFLTISDYPKKKFALKYLQTSTDKSWESVLNCVLIVLHHLQIRQSAVYPDTIIYLASISNLYVPKKNRHSYTYPFDINVISFNCFT